MINIPLEIINKLSHKTEPRVKHKSTTRLIRNQQYKTSNKEMKDIVFTTPILKVLK